LNGGKLSIGLGMDFAALIAIATLHGLILGTFANVNLVGAIAALSVAVAGIHGSKRRLKLLVFKFLGKILDRSSKKTC
jgi:Cu/Ag efflux pump CusA